MQCLAVTKSWLVIQGLLKPLVVNFYDNFLPRLQFHPLSGKMISFNSMKKLNFSRQTQTHSQDSVSYSVRNI